MINRTSGKGGSSVQLTGLGIKRYLILAQIRFTLGGVAERPNATDCKSVGISLRRFESSPLHQNTSKVYTRSGCFELIFGFVIFPFYHVYLVEPEAFLWFEN